MSYTLLNSIFSRRLPSDISNLIGSFLYDIDIIKLEKFHFYNKSNVYVGTGSKILSNSPKYIISLLGRNINFMFNNKNGNYEQIQHISLKNIPKKIIASNVDESVVILLFDDCLMSYNIKTKETTICEKANIVCDRIELINNKIKIISDKEEYWIGLKKITKSREIEGLSTCHISRTLTSKFDKCLKIFRTTKPDIEKNNIINMTDDGLSIIKNGYVIFNIKNTQKRKYACFFND